MKMPKFTAEASLYRMRDYYHMAEINILVTEKVIPQRMMDVDGGVPFPPIRKVCHAVCCVAINGRAYCYPCAVLC